MGEECAGDDAGEGEGEGDVEEGEGAGAEGMGAKGEATDETMPLTALTDAIRSSVRARLRMANAITMETVVWMRMVFRNSPIAWFTALGIVSKIITTRIAEVEVRVSGDTWVGIQLNILTI